MTITHPSTLKIMIQFLKTSQNVGVKMLYRIMYKHCSSQTILK
jgi:hypothetical protein